MANIAQTINVLQAMILTQDEKMILTPTYHVYEMFKGHQDATLLPTFLQCGDYQFGKDKIPAVNGSASRSQAGNVLVTVCNVDPNQAQALTLDLRGKKANQVTARVLTADTITAHNTFEQPDQVKPVSFNDFKLTDKGIEATLPSKSIVAFEIE